ncbi:MAG: ATP-binding protein [bacterium]
MKSNNTSIKEDIMQNASNTLLCTSIDIPSTAEYVAVIRLTVAGIASKLNFDIESIEDIKIAVSEACNNVIQHAYTQKNINTSRIKLEIETENNEFRIQIKDKGIGFNPNKIKSSNAENDEKLGLGLGIAFMKSLMDEASIESSPGNGTTITLLKKVPQQ